MAPMPIFEITHDAISRVPKTTLSEEKILERYDLQRILRENIKAIDPNCYVLAEEYGDWADSKRRIDLLCIDSAANLVVVELKRTEDAGHADLQAIRYAAMIHLMTFEEAIDIHAAYLEKSAEEAKQAILGFLGWHNPQEEPFAQDVRIILVSADFSKEVTSTAIWLNKKKLDVRCVRIEPYKLKEHILMDIQQIIPLPEAEYYQVQLRKKEEEERQSKDARTRSSNFLFSMLGIKPGTILVHTHDPNATCEVFDDRLVKFRGDEKPMSLGKSAGIVLGEHNLSGNVAGTHYWKLNGETLSNLRDAADKAKMS